MRFVFVLIINLLRNDLRFKMLVEKKFNVCKCQNFIVGYDIKIDLIVRVFFF